MAMHPFIQHSCENHRCTHLDQCGGLTVQHKINMFSYIFPAVNQILKPELVSITHHC